MAERAFTLLDERRVAEVPVAVRDGQVRISSAALHAALGWELKPQGFCRDDRCVPVGDRAGLITADGIDLAGFADVLRRPLAIDIAAGAACLGASATDRSAQLGSLVAPDFTLPDLSGKRHSLSAYRGKKVLLVAYASW